MGEFWPKAIQVEENWVFDLTIQYDGKITAVCVSTTGIFVATSSKINLLLRWIDRLWGEYFPTEAANGLIVVLCEPVAKKI